MSSNSISFSECSLVGRLQDYVGSRGDHIMRKLMLVVALSILGDRTAQGGRNLRCGFGNKLRRNYEL